MNLSLFSEVEGMHSVTTVVDFNGKQQCDLESARQTNKTWGYIYVDNIHRTQNFKQCHFLNSQNLTVLFLHRKTTQKCQIQLMSDDVKFQDTHASQETYVKVMLRNLDKIEHLVSICSGLH